MSEKRLRKFIPLLVYVTLASTICMQCYADPPPIVVSVYVYCDDEFVNRARTEYGYFYGDDWKLLAEIFVRGAEYPLYTTFNIEWQIIQITEYHSDTSNVERAIVEAMTENCWTQISIRKLMIALSGQDLYFQFGSIIDYSVMGIHCANHSDGVIMSEMHSSESDNIIQHEISHLYNCEHHVDYRNCVMETHNALQTRSWCSECLNIIWNSRSYFGDVPGGAGGGGFFPLSPTV